MQFIWVLIRRSSSASDKVSRLLMDPMGFVAPSADGAPNVDGSVAATGAGGGATIENVETGVAKDVAGVEGKAVVVIADEARGRGVTAGVLIAASLGANTAGMTAFLGGTNLLGTLMGFIVRLVSELLLVEIQ